MWFDGRVSSIKKNHVAFENIYGLSLYRVKKKMLTSGRVEMLKLGRIGQRISVLTTIDNTFNHNRLLGLSGPQFSHLRNESFRIAHH